MFRVGVFRRFFRGVVSFRWGFLFFWSRYDVVLVLFFFGSGLGVIGKCIRM